MRRRTQIGLLALLLSALFVPHGNATPLTPVEEWTGGDDGLTQRLADAVRKTFSASKLFVPSSDQRPGTMRISIVTHVRWEKIETRTKATAKIEVAKFPLPENPAAFFEVSCWDDELTVCADQVVNLTAKFR